MTTRKEQNTRGRDWPIILTAGVGLFLSTLDTGIMNVALPTLGRTFHVSSIVVAWTVTMYLLALTTTIVVIGRVSDRIGRLKVYSSGLIVFAITSILCGIASSAFQLILFRGLQGIAAAMLQATSAAIITTCIPQERRGTALGTLGMMLGLGPVLGPLIGGILLSFVGWRWIFYINVPICLVGLRRSLRLLKITKEQTAKMPMNIFGNLLLGVITFGILYGLSGSSSYGLTRLIPFCISLFALFGYIVWETRVSHPIVPLSLYTRGSFLVPILSVTILGSATAIVFLVPPYFLEQVLHLSPWKVGLVNLASPLGLVILSRVSGKFIDKWGGGRLMVPGFSMMFIALSSLSTMQTTLKAVVLFVLLLVYGVGAGIFVPANLSAIMGSVGKDLQGTIGSFQRMVQNIGIAVGTSFAASAIRSDSTRGTSGYLSAFHAAWSFASIAVLIGLLSMGLFRLRRRIVGSRRPSGTSNEI